MSEYQAYYFARAERPLSGSELEAVAALSSHIEVGAHSAFVHYHYGNFKHDPVQVLEKWFDVFVYYANWGAQTIGFRFDSDAVDYERIAIYDSDETLTISETDGDVLVVADFFENYGDYGYYDLSEDSGRLFAGYASLHRAILGGDDRALFLLWLKAQELGGRHNVSVPVPDGLGTLDPEHNALVELIDLHQDLIEAAAQLNPAPAPSLTQPRNNAHAKHLHRLSSDRATHYLERLLTEDPHSVRADLIRELRRLAPTPTKQEKSEAAVTTTFGEVERLAMDLGTERERMEEEARAARHRDYLLRLESKAPAMWAKVPELIERKQTKAYEQAAEILHALKHLATEKNEEAAFQKRASQIIEKYPSLHGMRSRMETAGILPDDDRPKSVKLATMQERWQKAHPPSAFFDFGLLQQ